MKKYLLLLTFFVGQQTFAQFPLHTILPMNVSGIVFGDTLLNTSELLKRAGIKKVYSYQTAPDVTKTFYSKTLNISPEGKIQSTLVCFKNKKSDAGFCTTDSLVYDEFERIKEFRSMDGEGVLYLKMLADYTGDGAAAYTYLTMPSGNMLSDTSYEQRYFNPNGQLVHLILERKGVQQLNAFLCYNRDGLPDSIRYENSDLETFVFSRKQKREAKQLALETRDFHFNWTYNSAGKCIAFTIEAKNKRYAQQNTSQGFVQKSEAKFYYNLDSTLNKVVEKRNGKSYTTTFYSYTK